MKSRFFMAESALLSPSGFLHQPQVPELLAKFNGPLQRLQLRSLSQLAKEAWSFCFVVSGWVALALTRLNSNIYIYIYIVYYIYYIYYMYI